MDIQIVYTDKLSATAITTFEYDGTLYVIVNSHLDKQLVDYFLSQIIRILKE